MSRFLNILSILNIPNEPAVTVRGQEEETLRNQAQKETRPHSGGHLVSVPSLKRSCYEVQCSCELNSSNESMADLRNSNSRACRLRVVKKKERKMMMNKKRIRPSTFTNQVKLAVNQISPTPLAMMTSFLWDLLRHNG